MTVPAGVPSVLKGHYEDMYKMKEKLEVMKKQQSLRGVENLKKRMAERAATHTSWRQMKGMQLVAHEMNHPGNKPFVIGLGVSVTMFLYAYTKGLGSDAAKAESKYWQRFHAKGDH